ncbi:dihydroneopterin aldolase [candidate division WOR-3 bacterium]|nr:dihydroneopterin aldolase [candidate division WOR-3 bacterium]
MLDRISLKKLKFYAYHGHAEVERNNGINIEIDAEIILDIDKAMISDNLRDTLDYRKVYTAVKEEVMNNRFNLLEKIARSIMESLFEKFSIIEEIKVTVKKPSPSLGGVVGQVEVCAFRKRDQLRKEIDAF